MFFITLYNLALRTPGMQLRTRKRCRARRMGMPPPFLGGIQQLTGAILNLDFDQRCCLELQ